MTAEADGHHGGRSHRPLPSPNGPLQRQFAVIAAGAAAVATTLISTCSPTGRPAIDHIEVAAAAFAVSLAGSRARRWTLMSGAAITTLFTPWPLNLVPAAAMFGSVGLFQTRRRHRVVGAVIGGGVAIAAANLTPIAWPTSVIAAAAMIPILLSGLQRTKRIARHRIMAATAAIACVAAVLAGATGLTALRIKSHLEDAARATSDAASDARGGNSEAATGNFLAAHRAFVDTESQLGKPWVSAASVLPIVSQNLGAVSTATHHGERITLAAASATGQLNYDSVQRPDGGIDTSALSNFSPKARRLANTMAQGRSDVAATLDDWLVSPLGPKLAEMSSELDRLGSDAEVAALATDLVPGILGASFPRRYFVMFSNPAESRDMGGLMASWAILTANGGKLEITETGSPIDLYGPSAQGVAIEPNPRIPASFLSMDPQRWPQNLTSTPRLETALLAINSLLPDTGRGVVDGILYLDPYALQAILGITGPVKIPGTDIELNNSNAAQFFLIDQFVKLPQTPETDAALQSLVSEVLHRATATKLPGPRQLASTFGGLIGNGHLRFATNRAQDAPLLDRLGLSGDYQRQPDDDLFGVFIRNVGPNKLDPYIKRSSTYTVAMDPNTDRVKVTATIALDNVVTTDLPAVVTGNESGLPAGTAHLRVGVLTPYQTASFSTNGKPLAATRTIEALPASGAASEFATLFRYTFDVELGPGDHLEVRMDAGATVPDGGYNLVLAGQASGVDDSRIAARATDSTGVVRTFTVKSGELLRTSVT